LEHVENPEGFFRNLAAVLKPAGVLVPGFAFGGSCLPKDVKALTYRAKELDQGLPLLNAIMPSNQAHIDRAVEAILSTRRKKIAVLGLSFKAKTDDLRESPLVLGPSDQAFAR
jgi:GDP-mannose 6-dehydrogenase